MRGQVWKLWLAVAATALSAFMVIPTAGWVRAGWQTAFGYAAVVAILVGLRRSRPGGRTVWGCFALGVFGNATGILVEQVDTVRRHSEGFPSAADGCYLTLYPAVAVGLAILIRRHGPRRDRGTLVDGAMVTTGLGLLAWVSMIHPSLSDGTLSTLGHVVSVAYPVGDLILLAMIVRLQLGGGGRAPAHWLIAGSLLAFFTADAAWAVVNQLGGEPGGYPGRLLSCAPLVAYTLFGIAALHPSAREVGQRTERGPQLPRRPQFPRRPLLAALTVAALVAPVVLAIQVLRGQVTDGLAIAIGCGALFLLVLTRMAQLLGEREEQAAKIRELSRTDELTGLPNRREWTLELPRAIERARRARLPLTIAMIDLDHSQGFNDPYGHPAGDRLLKEAAATWAAQVRAVDHLARYGDEEFILLLPDTDTSDSVQVIERLRALTPLGQTLSAGVATWDGGETSDEIIARADAALSEAKRAGRDLVVVAETSAAARRDDLIGFS